MTSVSYSQNREDILLARAFPQDYVGFYVDVGAWLPDTDSVTKLFYDRGWSGLNVEPGRHAFSELVRQRTRDINLPVAVAENAGEATFYEYNEAFAGRSTLDGELAGQYGEEGFEAESYTVTVTTLSDIFEEHVGERVVDFLKIDVEGNEEAALRGADFTRFRPRIVIVEATEPGNSAPAHESWEPLLLEAGYRFVIFDGLNRVYVDAPESALMNSLAIPVNVFDEFEPIATVQLQTTLAATHRHASHLEGEIERLQDENDRYVDALNDERGRRAELERSGNTARTVVADLRAYLEASEAARIRILDHLDDTRQALAATERELSALRSSPLGRLLFSVQKRRL
jgi:FkbM family methyltransferase